MKKILLLIIFLNLFSLSLSARINETIEQCRTRYGEPKAEKTSGPCLVKYYFKNGMNVMAVFYKDKAVVVNYAKPDSSNPFYKRTVDKDGWMDTISSPNIMEMNLPLPENEIEYLKNSNSENEKWTKTGDNIWQREKKTVAASYQKNILTFKVVKQNDNKDKPSYLNGF
ncbi:MAG: hypothetical protein A2017_16475 [Lentisphaerae bacterium GWF2_44_16]|nr:MAG: hypothetical protein A2017_16475 [Lentisphaerae bacterium GWF2_44_16]